MPPKRKASDDSHHDEPRRGPGRPTRDNKNTSETPAASITNGRTRRSSSPIKQSIETDEQPRPTRRKTQHSVDSNTLEVVADIETATPSPRASRRTPSRTASRQTSIRSQPRSTRAAKKTTTTIDAFNVDLSMVREETPAADDWNPRQNTRTPILKSSKKRSELKTRSTKSPTQFGEDTVHYDMSDGLSEAEGAEYAAASHKNVPHVRIKGSPSQTIGDLVDSSVPSPAKFRGISPQRTQAYTVPSTARSFSRSVPFNYPSIPDALGSPTRQVADLQDQPRESPSRQFILNHPTLPPMRNTQHRSRYGIPQISPGRAPILSPSRRDEPMSGEDISPSSHGVIDKSIRRDPVTQPPTVTKRAPRKTRPLQAGPHHDKDSGLDHSNVAEQHDAGAASESFVDHYGNMILKMPRVQAAIDYLSGYDASALRPPTHHQEAYAVANRRKTLSEIFTLRIIEAAAFFESRWLSVPLSALGAGLLFPLTFANDVATLDIIGQSLQDPRGACVRIFALFLFLIGLCDVIDGIVKVFRGIARRTWTAAQAGEASDLFVFALVRLCQSWIWSLVRDILNHVFTPAATLLLTTAPVISVNISAYNDQLESVAIQACQRFVNTNMFYHIVTWTGDSLSRQYGPLPRSRRGLGLRDFWTKVIFSILLIVYGVRQQALLGDVAHSIKSFYSTAQTFYTNANGTTGGERWHGQGSGKIVHTSLREGLVDEGTTALAQWASSETKGPKALITAFVVRNGTGLEIEPISEVPTWTAPD